MSTASAVRFEPLQRPLLGSLTGCFTRARSPQRRMSEIGRMSPAALVTPRATSPLLRRHLEHQIEPNLVAEAAGTLPGFPDGVSRPCSEAWINPFSVVRFLIERGARLEWPRVIAHESLELRQRHIKPSLAQREGLSHRLSVSRLSQPVHAVQTAPPELDRQLSMITHETQ